MEIDTNSTFITVDFSPAQPLCTIASLMGPQTTPDRAWARILRVVEKKVESGVFKRFFLGTRGVAAAEDGVLGVELPTGEDIPEKYTRFVWKAIEEIGLDIHALDFNVKGWRPHFKTRSQLNQNPLKYVAHRLMPVEGVTGWGGLSGHGKTYLMMSMAKTILTGGLLWGRFRTDQYPVLYLVPESGDSSFHHRMKLLGIPDTPNFLVRTMSQGATLSLASDVMLEAAKGRVIFLDTLPRFTEGRDEQQARDMAALGELLFGLLQAGAVAVNFAHHSPKSSRNELTMDLENVFRGSGDIGAILSAGHGVRMLDVSKTLIQVENVKARDFEPLKPFQLEGRPWIDREGTFHMVKTPGTCSTLAVAKEEKAIDDLTGKILAVIKKRPGLSGNQICKTLKANRNRVYAALRQGEGKHWKEETNGYYDID
ncbi:MAG TPA: AAA family ATPase [Candidatus Angelobacter sp.]|nr:AAA family ATPase [Candidatus Angelobacter sp.]